jgi:2-hydroxy-3-keto-5-methylthiopentenyl-1-phosphate phosphatase
LTVEQSNKLQYALIQEPEEVLRDFILQHIDLRPGFLEFVGYCRDNTIPLVIVSSGVDFYIDTVFAEIGMSNVELYCGHATFHKTGIDVIYRDPEGGIINAGFKEKYLVYLKKRSNKVIYIGDGLSDIGAAQNAYYVFARDNLLKLLDTDRVSGSAFSDFYDVVRQIDHIR